jgi:hypothetical protein
VKFVHLTGTPSAFEYAFLFMSSRFGDGHSKKYATLTSLAAELATVAVRVNANKIPRTVLIIFFIVLPYGLLIIKI